MFAVIVAESMMDCDAIVQFIDDLHAEAIPYETIHARPMEDTRIIISKVRDFCARNKWL